MRKHAWPALFLAAALFFPLAAAAQNLQTALVPAEAKWIIHLDVARLAKTRAKDFLFGDSVGGIGNATRKIERIAKVDFLKDMTGVTILGLGPREDDTVVAFAGKLDKDYLLALIGLEKSAKEIPYGKHVIYNWDSDMYGVFVSDRLTLAGGNPETIRLVLDVMEGKRKSAAGAPLLAKLKSAPADAFLTAATENLSSLAGDRDASTFLKKTGAAFLNVTERGDILKLDLVLNTDSAETAANLARVADGLIGLQAMRGGRPSENAFDLLKDLKITPEGSVLRATLETRAENLTRRLFPMAVLPHLLED
jgi:hypothetical protein